MLHLVRLSTGERITQVRSAENGILAIMINEEEDKEIGCYIKDNYDIQNDAGESIL